MENFAAVEQGTRMRVSMKWNLAVGLAMALAGLPLCAADLSLGWHARATQDQQQQPDQQKDKKKGKKKKKEEPGPSAEDSPDNAAGARRAVSRVVHDLQDGFEGHSPRRVTELLDEHFEDLPRFEDAVTQFLERTSEMRMNFRESTSEVKGDHATVIADAEMISTDKARPTPYPPRREPLQSAFIPTPKTLST